MKILFTPLNWGLGHTTRSAALADRYRKEGHQIVWGAYGDALEWLQMNCPQDQIHNLDDLDISYGRSVWRSVVYQSSDIRKFITREQRKIKNLVNEIKPDQIISDNRYGCYYPEVHSVLITHQIRPRLPWFLRFLNPLRNIYFKSLLGEFNEIWVPDYPDRRLSGALSKPYLNQKVVFMGPLSRFTPLEKPSIEIPETLILTSGPKGSRKYFVEDALKHRKGITWVVGLKPTVEEKDVVFIEYPKQSELAQWIQFCSLLISRPGYSTIMDREALGAKGNVVWIPTPGQTEQEYLASILKH
jgi:uncharacterized protein (TIGR00661 family)